MRADDQRLLDVGSFRRAGDERADGGVLVGRGAHQRHLRVVFVEQPSGMFGGNSPRTTEIDHVAGAD